MYAKVLLIALAVLPLLANCQSRRPTYCERWKGSSEFVCRKTDYRADSIHIRNIGNSNVSFRVSKWMSRCGQMGVNYSDGRRQLAPGASLDEIFHEAEGAACNELFIADCLLGGLSVDCVWAVTPSVNLQEVQCVLV